MSTALKKVPELTVENIHAPFVPADVYHGENISARFACEKSGKELNLRVWRISPIGVELLLSTEELATVNGAKHKNGLVSVAILIGGQRCEYEGLKVSEAEGPRPGSMLFGLRWVSEGTNVTKEDADRRSTRRWICGDEFLPTGVTPNPTRFGDFIHFRVKDISKSGMGLITSLRNRYLLPGMTLQTQISFPLFGVISMRFKIGNVRPISYQGKEQLFIGAEFIDLNPDYLGIISSYIMQFSPGAEAGDLKSENLLPRFFSDHVDFGFVKSQEDFKEVLDLRLLSYRDVGKVSADKKAEEMADNFDTRSRIIVARHAGRIIASLRVMFHAPEDMMELEQYVSDVSSLPRKDEIVEVTRFCIHPDYQGGDIIFGIMNQLFLVMAQARRRYIVSFAGEDMLGRMYQKFGAKVTGVKFNHPKLNGAEQEVFVFDINALLSGRSVGPVVWNMLFADIYAHMHTNDFMEFDPLTGARLFFYRLFRPLAFFKRKSFKDPTKANWKKSK
ncbi:MAG TPA: GNAT family N-acyltransferase [Bdellovibrionota bacterium]|jgi:N-acyl-L-homoserine lactone synthetase|nr:GNAT family N-acyltransferase [Bdellovibrionota bacterium]